MQEGLVERAQRGDAEAFDSLARMVDRTNTPAELVGELRAIAESATFE